MKERRGNIVEIEAIGKHSHNDFWSQQNVNETWRTCSIKGEGEGFTFELQFNYLHSFNRAW